MVVVRMVWGKIFVVVCIFSLTFSLEKCIYGSVNNEVNNKTRGG